MPKTNASPTLPSYPLVLPFQLPFRRPDPLMSRLSSAAPFLFPSQTALPCGSVRFRRLLTLMITHSTAFRHGQQSRKGKEGSETFRRDCVPRAGLFWSLRRRIIGSILKVRQIGHCRLAAGFYCVGAQSQERGQTDHGRWERH